MDGQHRPAAFEKWSLGQPSADVPHALIPSPSARERGWRQPGVRVLSETPWRIERRAPRLAEHNGEIIGALK